METSSSQFAQSTSTVTRTPIDLSIFSITTVPQQTQSATFTTATSESALPDPLIILYTLSGTPVYIHSPPATSTDLSHPSATIRCTPYNSYPGTTYYTCVSATITDVSTPSATTRYVSYPSTTTTYVSTPSATTTYVSAPPATTPSSFTPSTTPTDIPSSSPPSGPDNGNNKSSLGIGLGVSLGVIAFIGIIYGAWRLGRRSRPAYNDVQSPGIADEKGLQHTWHNQAHEMAQPVAELPPSSRPVAEMPSPQMPSHPS